LISEAHEGVGIEDLWHAYELAIEFKGIVAESLCVSKEHRLSMMYPQYRADLEKLSELRRRLQFTYSNVFQGVPQSAREQVASSVRFEKEAMEDLLRKLIPELRPERQSPSVRDVANALKEFEADSALIDFVRVGWPDSKENNRLVAFILPAGRPDLLRLVT